MSQGFLEQGLFAAIVQNAPLVALDFIVTDIQTGKILLGKRTNPPARGYWFVPGGRVRKRETLADAATRITQAELGQAQTREMNLLGVFEHFYDDWAFGREHSTHYIVIAQSLELHKVDVKLSPGQHSESKWFSRDALLANELVHDHVKHYFQGAFGIRCQ